MAQAWGLLSWVPSSGMFSIAPEPAVPSQLASFPVQDWGSITGLKHRALAGRHGVWTAPHTGATQGQAVLLCP